MIANEKTLDVDRAYDSWNTKYMDQANSTGGSQFDIPKPLAAKRLGLKKIRNWIVLIILLVLLLFLAIIGWEIILGLQLRPAPVRPNVLLAPTSTPDPMTNWKTYTNHNFLFSFKYPPYWEANVTNDLVNCCASIVLRPIFPTHDPMYRLKDSNDIKEFGIVKITINRSNQTMEQVLAETCPSTAICYKNSIQTTTLAGSPATRIASPSAFAFDTLYSLREAQDNKIVYKKVLFTFELQKVTGSDWFASISLDERKKLFDQILSTFKFFDQKTPSTNNGTYQCANYRNIDKTTHACATCGNNICEAYETCTSSMQGKDTSTPDCGVLYCEVDCQRQ